MRNKRASDQASAGYKYNVAVAKKISAPQFDEKEDTPLSDSGELSA